MDRDNNWDREEKAYAAFDYGEGNHAANAQEAIDASKPEMSAYEVADECKARIESGTGDVNLRVGGCLADIAPTMLPYLGLPVPVEMTGKSIIVE